MSDTSRSQENEQDKVKFNKKVRGQTLKIEPENVKKVKWVNGACADIELKSGETVRVKGNVSKVKDKLGQQVKPEGIENYDMDPAKDKKLKHFVN